MHALEKQVAAGITLFSVLVLLSGTVTAANTPSHPLSHITPTDSNLNFSNNPNALAYNISGLGGIQNYFANNCAPDQVVRDIFPDGSFNCVDRQVGDVNGTGSPNKVAFFVDSETIDSDPSLHYDSTSDYLGIQTGSPSYPLDVAGTARISGDIRGVNNLVNFFASACPDGEAIADVNSDGSFNCRPLGNVADVWVNQTGDTMTGNLNMTGNNITELRALSGFFDNACTGGDVVQQVYDNGTVVCTDPAEAGTENLSETLASGNEAGSHSINMAGNNIFNINALSIAQPLTDDNVSDTITVDASGIQGTITNPIDTGFFTTTTPLADGNISDTITVHASGIQGTITNPIDTGFFTTTTPLADGNISDSITIGPAGTVNSSAIEERIAGDQLTYTDGVLDVQETGLDADTLDGEDSGHYRQNLSQVLVEGNRANTSINMDGNSLQNFFDTACGDGQVVDSVNSDGTYTCATVDNEVTDIWVNESGDTMSGGLDMGGNSITTIGDLGGTDIVDSANILDATIIADDIAASAVNTTHIVDGTVISTDIQDGTIASVDIGVDAVGNSEIDNTANIDLNSLSVAQGLTTGNLSDGAVTSAKIADGTIVDRDVSDTANLDLNSLSVEQPLADGNISQSISIDNGPLYAQNGGSAVGVGTDTPNADLDVDGSADLSSSGTDMQVQDDGDIVITLGSG